MLMSLEIYQFLGCGRLSEAKPEFRFKGKRYGALMGALWEIENPETGDIELEKPSHSFTRNFADVMLSFLKLWDTTTSGTYTLFRGPLALTDTTGTSQTPFWTYANVHVEASANITDNGIIVGDGTQVNWYAMGNPRTDLNYQNNVVQPIYEGPDVIEIRIERIIGNTTGVDVNLTEIGLLMKGYTYNTTIQFSSLLVYDVISPAYTLPNGDSRLFRLKIILPK